MDGPFWKNNPAWLAYGCQCRRCQQPIVFLRAKCADESGQRVELFRCCQLHIHKLTRPDFALYTCNLCLIRHVMPLQPYPTCCTDKVELRKKMFGRLCPWRV